MKLFDVPRNTKVRILSPVEGSPPGSHEVKEGDVVDFYHIDGMYSYCLDANPANHRRVLHLKAWQEVEIV